MLQQYLDIKAMHRDCILFFRLGDFYEMFFDDAEVASRLLGITLTARDGGTAGKVPMCGVPFHAAESYLARLISLGHKVAICEQVEDPRDAKGLVRREVVRTITPATAHDAPSDTNSYILCWLDSDDACALAAVDYTTGSSLGRIFQGKRRHEQAADEILRLAPKEIIVSTAELPDEIRAACTRQQALVRQTSLLSSDEASEVVYATWGETNLASLLQQALGEIIYYLRQLKVGGFGHFTLPVVESVQGGMALDIATRRNLEITVALRSGEREGSLLWVLDYTVTAMGARLIKQWLEQPLVNISRISARLNAVEALHEQNMWRTELRAALGRVYDLERLLSKVTGNTANPRDMFALATSMTAVGKVKNLLQGTAVALLVEIYQELNPHEDFQHLLLTALDHNAPLSYREGGVIRPGFSSEVDRLRAISQDTKVLLASFESREREATGIKSLKVGYNRVFGYYLEATNSHLASIPPRYHRKQTLANGERYITEELKELENAILTAEDRLVTLEEELFLSLREQAAGLSGSMVQVARQLAILDVLQSFAEAAVRHRFYRPEVTFGQTITISNGRHAVVERTLGSHAFVPNDTHLRQGELAVLTGPNMAGKSTYMRQVALIVLMAQVGCFVPAEKAVIGYVDRIFTRVGAADDLYSGHSTFMLEMLETGTALTEATSRSLLLFDEVGRGTSTYDGMALAQAIMEFVHDHIQARTIFSTHYHELTGLSQSLTRCHNYVVAVLESGKEVVFLHRVHPGKANKSYGIHVARMAGLPPSVVKRAVALLKDHESSQRQPYHQGNFLGDVAEVAKAVEIDARTTAALDMYNQVANMAPEALTPLQALNLLHDLKEKTLKERENDEN